MPDAPGPDDPRYWERLKNGPPLDEWRAVDAPPQPRRYGPRAWGPLVAIGVAVIGVVAWANHGSGGGTLTFADMPVCTQPVTTDPCRDGAAVVYAVGGRYVTFPTYDEWLAYVGSAADDAGQVAGNPTDFR